MRHQVVPSSGQSNSSTLGPLAGRLGARWTCLAGSRQDTVLPCSWLTRLLAAWKPSAAGQQATAGGRTVLRYGWYSVVVAMPLLLLSACGPRDCWDIRGCHSSYMEYQVYPMPAPSYTPGTAYSDIPMSSGTIMQGGRATGYYSTFGNQTTIIQPGHAPVYIDRY